MGSDRQAARIAEICNAAWWVRNYGRPAKEIERRNSVRALGLLCRSAFAETDDFEPLLRAIVESLDGGRF